MKFSSPWGRCESCLNLIKCTEVSLCPITATELKQLTCMMHSMRYSWAKASLQFTTCSSIPGRTIWNKREKVLQWFYNYLLSLYSHTHLIQAEQNFYQLSADSLHKDFLIRSPIFLQFHPSEKNKKTKLLISEGCPFHKLCKLWFHKSVPLTLQAHTQGLSSTMAEFTRDRLLNNTFPSLSSHTVTVLLNALGSTAHSLWIYPRTPDVYTSLRPTHYSARKMGIRKERLEFLVTVTDLQENVWIMSLAWEHTVCQYSQPFLRWRVWEALGLLIF